jgi:membrane-bound lytic murein transglycosylase A
MPVVPLRAPLFRTALMCVVALAGCKVQPTQPVEPEPQPPPRERALYKPVAWRSVPGWAEDSIIEAWHAFLSSCAAMRTHETWRLICADARTVSSTDAAAQRRFFEERFEPVRLLRDTGHSQIESEGLITGYYEPLLQGSRKRRPGYSVPLYGVPDDLLTIDLSSLYPELAGKRLRGRLEGKKVVPYYSRAEIDSAPSVRGKELVWVSDAVDAFFLQVQGSGRVRLDTGETIRMQFADVNGHPYRSIGRYLVEQGALTLDEATAPGIRAWIREHPERAQEVLNANPSVVFFKEVPLRDPLEGPRGSLGVPLTANRSLAVDPRYIPLGTPVFVATMDPLTQTPLRHLMIAQDTGGAIKGILRADWFFGHGATAAERAGRMRNQAGFWLLWPKDMALPDGGG